MKLAQSCRFIVAQSYFDTCYLHERLYNRDYARQSNCVSTSQSAHAKLVPPALARNHRARTGALWTAAMTRADMIMIASRLGARTSRPRLTTCNSEGQSAFLLLVLDLRIEGLLTERVGAEILVTKPVLIDATGEVEKRCGVVLLF